jgi:DNA invertase Pin-like site-specific DNA recombinase
LLTIGGYARVSTEDQHLDQQRDPLTRARCARTFEDRRSGTKADRPGLAAALDYGRAVRDAARVRKKLGRALMAPTIRRAGDDGRAATVLPEPSETARTLGRCGDRRV